MSDRRPPLAFACALVACAVVTIAALAASVALAAKGAPPATARNLAQTYFSSTLIRAEVLSAVGRVQHDYRIDVGRVTAVRPSALDLLERDGTRQTITLGPQATVTEGGQTVDSSAIVRGLTALTVRINDAPAQQIFLAAGVLGVGK